MAVKDADIIDDLESKYGSTGDWQKISEIFEKERKKDTDAMGDFSDMFFDMIT